MNTNSSESLSNHQKSLLLLKQLDLNKNWGIPTLSGGNTITAPSSLRQTVVTCQTDIQKSFYMTDVNMLQKASKLLDTALWESADQKLPILLGVLNRHVDWLCVHSIHVALISMILSLEIQFRETSLNAICQGSLLHDLGKLMISPDILQKPDKLNHHEQHCMQKHCELGHLLAKELGLHSLCQTIALLHHEYMDGSGYPFGLRAGQIPQEVQIVAVADLIGAITTCRPYQCLQPLSSAVKELKSCSKKYSAQLVKTMEKYI